MKRFLVALALTAGLAACADLDPAFDSAGAALAPSEDDTRPMPRPGEGAPPPSSNATTAEAFDTTTAEERVAAQAAPKPAGEQLLGTTIATLGNPADPGFWLETPLVSSARPGRVVARATGESVQVELRPIDGPSTAGSRISLPALRLLGVGLTGLHELTVYAG